MQSIAEKMLLSEPTTKIWMKIDPHYQQQKCRPITLVSGNIRFMRIFAGDGEGASNDSGLIENVNFRAFGRCLRHLRKWGQHYYIVLSTPLLPFQWSTLNDLDWLFRVKFCFHAGLAGWHRATSENNCVKTNEGRHILSAVQIFGRDSSFWQYKICPVIQSGSLERKR